MTGRATSLPLGLALTIVVARALGQESFAHFSVAASVTLLAQSLMNAVFSHSPVKIVAGRQIGSGSSFAASLVGATSS